MDTTKMHPLVDRMRACRLTGIAVLALMAPGGFTSEASAQPSCRVGYTTWNSNRLVLGPVDAECRVGIWPWKHSRPFGNWGVKTESSGKKDGYQFEGWCNNHSVRDPEDGNRLKTFCRDGWYEWNSCTFHGWSPPNRDFYNHDNYRQQKSTTGRSNNHGGGVVWIATGCPTDTNRDGRADSGGCKDALGQNFTIANHRMELYELDSVSRDSHVETLYFPDLVISTSDMDCDPYGCATGAYGAWKHPVRRSHPVPVTSAQVTVQIKAAFFVDPYNQCSGE